MSDEELEKYVRDKLKKDDTTMIWSHIAAIECVITKNKLISQETFKELVDRCFDEIVTQKISNMSDEERQQIEALSRFGKLFGGLI
jgi:uncharacterized protein with PIN domain